MSAGLGTRLRPFTDAVAKPILPLLGVPMAQFALDALKSAGVTRVVANVHHLASHTSNALRFLEGPRDLRISDESSLLLGSAGGLARALPQFEGQPFFLMNADTLSSLSLPDLMRRHQKLRHDHGVRITLAILKQSPRGGKYREIHLDPKRDLIRAAGDLGERVPFFMGVAVIEPEALEGISPDRESNFLEEILQPAIRLGKAGFYLVDNTILPDQKVWFDIGDAKLWHQTHLDLLQLWEEEELPTLWRNRIERSVKRLAPGIYVAKSCALDSAPAEWKAPCFWAPDLGETAPPSEMAASTILYGKPIPESVGKSGIGFRGLWQSV